MSGITRFFSKFLILAAMLLGLPLGGVYWTGYPVLRYLEFPPKTTYVRHAPYSWVAFALYTLLISACLVPILINICQASKKVEPRIQPKRSFPWWGWIGLVSGVMAWVLAWTRFEWLSGLQPHTFTPLWLAFILVINGLSYRYSGACMLLNRPVYFLLLFPTSAAFWWFFEYLNRFVQNWFYTGPEFSSWEYFWYATIPFSTVLPAVLSLRDWILSTHWFRQKFSDFTPIRIPHPKVLAAFTLAASASGLAGIGVALQAEAGNQQHWALAAEEPGQPANILGLEPCNGRRALGGILGDALAVGLKAERMPAEKLPIAEPLVDDRVGDTQRQDGDEQDATDHRSSGASFAARAVVLNAFRQHHAPKDKQFPYRRGSPKRGPRRPRTSSAGLTTESPGGDRLAIGRIVWH